MLHKCCQPTKSWADLNRRLSVKQLLELQDELNEIVKPGWASVLSENHFITALLDEYGCEVLGSGIDWKHWKYTDPSNFDFDNVKIEIIDCVFFYAALMILFFNDSEYDPMSALCKEGSKYDQFDFFYVGTDKGGNKSGIGILCGQNSLNHANYVDLLRYLIKDFKDIYFHIEILDRLVSCIGLSSEEFSAYYISKWVLNVIRATGGYQDGSYVKIDIDGVEDNDRLHPLVKEFMDDTEMTLEMLKQNVIDEFYEEV